MALNKKKWLVYFVFLAMIFFMILCSKCSKSYRPLNVYQNVNKPLFENSDRVAVNTIEETLNGIHITFDDKFLDEIKEIYKKDVEESFRNTIKENLKKMKLQDITTFSSTELNKIVKKKGKKFVYEIHEIVANVKIPSLNINEYTNYTSVFIFSVKNKKLIQTQCVIQKIDENVALRKECKDEIKAKHGIILDKKDLIYITE